MFDDHDRGLGHIDADLNHRGGDEEVEIAAAEFFHDLVFFRGLHAAMDQPDPCSEAGLEDVVALLGGREIDFLGLFHQRADPINTCAGFDLPFEAIDHIVHFFRRDQARIDRFAAGRLFIELADLHIAIGGEGERAWDGCRGHHEDVRARALGLELEPLVHAEAVLFVDHGHAQISKRDTLLEDRMGADDDLRRAAGNLRQ